MVGKIFKEFEIPCGVRDDDFLVYANKSRDEDHRCPSCHCLLEKCDDVFMHPSSWGCDMESVLHRTATILIVQFFEEWKEKKGKPIRYKFACLNCESISGERDFKDIIRGAYADFPVRNSKGEWSVDVALLDKENARHMQAAYFKSYSSSYWKEAASILTAAQKECEIYAAIKIRCNAAISKELSKGIMKPWFEVLAKDVVLNPYLLKIVDYSTNNHECQKDKNRMNI